MLPHRLGYLALGAGQIEELGHRGHVDALGTGGAVAAVHAVALPADPGHGGEGGGVVLFAVRSVLIGGAGFQLLYCPGPRHDAGHSGPGEGVVQALEGGEGHPGGGVLAEQVAAAEGLHHRDAHPLALAALIQGLALRVHVHQLVRICRLCPQLFHVLARGLEVVTGVDAEHEHVDEPAVRRRLAHLRVMTGQADAADLSRGFQLLGVGHHRAVDYLVPVGQSIGVVDHADVDEAGVQQAEHVLKASLYLCDVPGAQVLAIFPDGAQVGLEDKLVPPALQGAAQVGPHVRIGGVQVDAVDAQLLHLIHKRQDLLIALVHQALAAHSDLADRQPGAAQCTVVHGIPPCF